MEISNILARQQEIGDVIERMASNFKKDSLSRKTSEYCTKRAASLNALWEEFTINHDILLKAPADQSKEPYFVERFFEEVEQLQLRLRSWLEDIGKGFHPGSGPSEVAKPQKVSDVSQHSVNRLSRRLKTLGESINFFLESIKREEDGSRSARYFQLKIDRLLTYEVELKENLNLMLEETLDDYSEEFARCDELQQAVQRQIIDLQDQLDLLYPKPLPQEEHYSHGSNRVRLPKITLPIFNGDYLLWTQFHDLYVQLIHSQPLSNTEKMYYLTSNLSGEAKSLVRHLSITSDNYETAWNIIVNRYNNTRLIVTATLNKLLGQPSITAESASAIKSLHDTTKECFLALKNQKVGVQSWSPILLHLILRKLDKSTHTLYEQSLKNPKEFGLIEEFLQFLEGRFQALETVQRDETSKKHDVNGGKKARSVLAANTPEECLCSPQQHHQLFKCKEFLALKPEKRQHYLIKSSRCLNCMKVGHFASQCASRGCLKCSRKHNTLIHLPETTRAKPQSANTQNPNSTALTTQLEDARSGYVLLGTASVKISIGNQEPVVCRALLDSGSQINLITENLARKLNVNPTQDSVVIEGVGEAVQKASNRINILVSAASTDYMTRMEAFVLKKITGLQPVKYVNIQSWPIPENFKLADTKFNRPGRIDMLIGAEFYHHLMLPGKHILGPELPFMQNTLLGWIVAGKVANIDGDNRFCNICTSCDTDINLSKQIERFWRLEETSPEQPFTESEMRCEKYFKQETRRSPEGRFIVRLPFKKETTALGDSETTALKRFYAIEKRLAVNKEVKRQYVEFMEEYLRLNHMKPVNLANIEPPYYFLPHHYVSKPESTTTKLRVVFDASAKTTSNVSLNDILSKGPVIQEELFSILLRFRMPRYVFTGDIEKMYRQVMVHDDDQKYQLVFWRSNPGEDLKCYQLTTITYGTTSAPYLAIKALQTLGEQRSTVYPLGAMAIKRDFYVDDVITGSDSITEAFQIQTELIALLKEGGFRLRKWCANHPRLLERFQPEDLEVVLNFNSDADERIKTLGLIWCPKKDVFRIQPSVPTRDKINKRAAYSDIAHIFDPLGILSPIVVTAKLLLQEMWALKSDWDTQLPAPLEAKWLDFRNSLHELKDFTFPRHVFDHQFAKKIQLHTFADASEKAYGAAVYIRALTKEGLLLVRLLCAKSRVAPAKKETIPRLELCAAKLAAELCSRVKADLSLNNVEEHYWTDSTIVLAWLNRSSSSQQTFIANRVASIQRLTSVNQWRHVESEDNPADVLSRGTTPAKFKNHLMWFYGPIFLNGSESLWPSRFTSLIVKALPISMPRKIIDVTNEIQHGNSFSKLQRVVAYVVRFTNRLRKIHNHHKHLTPEELDTALCVIVKSMQRDGFSNDIKQLRQTEELPKDSSLHGLTPFIDGRGIVRVGGRLEEAGISFDAKHPMLLPYMHPFTKMLMEDLHRRHFHAPPQTLLSIVKQKFWPIKGKIIARSVVHHCIQCAKAAPRLLNQVMGNLPASRIEPARPFVTTGVDFCGPFLTHYPVRGKRPVKSYIAIFCCFATKAVHLEVVTDLTTNAFLGALKRFVSRRGHCKDIYSDNATNFVGANNHLNEVYESIYNDKSQEEIANTCASKGITFHFIPPRAPHFGGLWEAAVKSTKRLMRDALKNASLTYEELETLVIQVEAILNSRPLTPLSTDPNDLTPLTPGHFLIGEPLINNVDPSSKPLKVKLSRRWEEVQKIKNDFWKKWSLEYLHLLQKRQKWKEEQPDVKPGMIVMIHEDNMPPLHWPLGRINAVHKGSDNRVRVVDIKTATKTIKRPIHKIAPLPVDIDDTIISNDVNTNGVKVPAKHKPIEPISLPNRSSNREERPPTKRRRTLGSVLTTILVVCLALPSTRASVIETEPFNETQPTVYFENLGQASIVSSEWQIIVYYNMTSYWKEYTTLRNAADILYDLCSKLVENRVCSDTIRKIQFQLQKIEEDDRLMLHKTTNKRSKRGAINIVGNIANSLFGVLDSNYAERMEEIIDDTTSNQQRFLQMLKNQTSILDSTVNIMRNNYNRINEHFSQLTIIANKQAEKMNQIDQEIVQQHLFSTYMAHAIQLFTAVNDLQQAHRALMDTIVDAHHGKINSRILAPQQLLQELHVIKSHLPKTLALAIPEDDLVQIYRLMTVSVKPGSRYTIIQIKVPLEANEEFEFFRITSIPTLIKDEMWAIKTTTPYVIASLHKDQYYPVDNTERSACKQIRNHIFCKQQHPIYKAGFGPNKCELSLFNRETAGDKCELQPIQKQSYWFQLFATNKWLFSMDKITVINGVCNGVSSQLTLQAAGIVTIGEGCVVKQPHLTIQAHNMYESVIQRSYAVSMNFYRPATLTTKEVLLNISQSTLPLKNVEDLQKRVSDQRVSEASTELSVHHIHHYLVGYLGLGLAVFLVILVSYKALKHRNRQPTPKPRRPFKLESKTLNES